LATLLFNIEMRPDPIANANAELRHKSARVTAVKPLNRLGCRPHFFTGLKPGADESRCGIACSSVHPEPTIANRNTPIGCK